jgi:8-oxo-dGTP pyrophosphatase MutT (NUDIX family)
MSKHQKVAVIVWTADPEEKRRFLLRHNKPFNGYEDEWTITFGNIEEDENFEEAAKREAGEEFGIDEYEEIKNLNYKIEFEGKQGPTEAHFVALKVNNLDIPITLNEESIGYDWMLIEKVKEVMKHGDEKEAFNLIK